jgi:hypothetical protein
VAEINITQDEAEALIAMEKVRVDDKEWLFPMEGGRLAIPLTSRDKREYFSLDVYRGKIVLTKATYQNRARQAIILLRLDLAGGPHQNPENLPPDERYHWLAPYAGQIMPCPHLHIYVESFGDRWAIPAPVDRYSNPHDLFATFESFIRHCNIIDPPRIEKGLFS